MLLKAGKYEEMLSVPITNVDMDEYGTDELMGRIGDILDACPPDLPPRYPLIILRFALEALLRGRDDLYTQCREIIDRALQTPSKLTVEERRHLRGEYMFLRSFALDNALGRMVVAQKAALELLGGRPRHWTSARSGPTAYLRCLRPSGTAQRRRH